MKHTIESTLAILSQQGIPPPVEEYQFFSDRKWRFDRAWPALELAWEIEGGTRKQGRHNRHAGYSEDCVKYSTAAILGWAVIRTTSEQVASGAALSLLEWGFKLRYVVKFGTEIPQEAKSPIQKRGHKMPMTEARRILGRHPKGGGKRKVKA